MIAVFGGTIDGIAVIEPKKILEYENVSVYICSDYWKEIYTQCDQLGLKKVFLGEIKMDNYLHLSGILRLEASNLLLIESMNKANSYLAEAQWRDRFVDTVFGYRWYNVKSISLGGWAVGYQYAYVLSRILNIMKPVSILECGLGQSTKIINSYVEFFDMTFADIVEHDREWKDFFAKETVLNDRVNIHIRELAKEEIDGKSCYVYNDFSSVISGKKYNLISIDGPWGGDDISRIDIIKYIPDMLENSFAIIVDDYDRVGEKNTVKRIMEKLSQKGIKAELGVYSGEKQVAIIVPNELRFFVSM